MGNIYLGGTGKTPTSILIANEIKNNGKKVAILRKFYKTHKDEHNLIRNSFSNLILSHKRVEGIIEAEKLNYDVVILDDGFQDYSFNKNLNIICFNQRQLIGNGLVLPAGPLREKISSLKQANVVIINGAKDRDFEEKILNINKKLEIFYSFYQPLNLDEFKDKKLLAVAGIGNPENFFELIEKNNLLIERKYIFPDHYKLSKNEVLDIVKIAEQNDYQIIMTEKDYFKINNYNISNIKYLKVLLRIENQEKLFTKIRKLYD